jgi:hypothetical protein
MPETRLLWDMGTSSSDSAGRAPTVSESIGFRPDMEMDVIGWAIFLTMLVVVVPLLPFLIVYLAVSWLLDRLRRLGG